MASYNYQKVPPPPPPPPLPSKVQYHYNPPTTQTVMNPPLQMPSPMTMSMNDNMNQLQRPILKRQVVWDTDHVECCPFGEILYNCICPCLAVSEISNLSLYPKVGGGAACIYVILVFISLYLSCFSFGIAMLLVLILWKRSLGRKLSIRKPGSNSCMDHVTCSDTLVLIIGLYACWISSVKRTVERNNQAGKEADMMRCQRNYNTFQPVTVAMQQPQHCVQAVQQPGPTAPGPAVNITIN